MKQLTILLMLCLQLLSDDINWEDDFTTALELSNDEVKPIMLMYTQEDCGTCWYMKHKVFINEPLAEFINQNFIPVILDIDEEVIARYKPIGTPTFFFLRPDGSILKKITGGAKIKAFKQALDKIVLRYNKK